jgi:DNA-directed RNA polymerase specialized sigma24 family protein
MPLRIDGGPSLGTLCVIDRQPRRLDGGQRDLLRQCYEGTQSIKDIAVGMRISAAALTMRLQRIKQALLKCIQSSLAVEGRQ